MLQQTINDSTKFRIDSHSPEYWWGFCWHWAKPRLEQQPAVAPRWPESDTWAPAHMDWSLHRRPESWVKKEAEADTWHVNGCFLQECGTSVFAFHSNVAASHTVWHKNTNTNLRKLDFKAVWGFISSLVVAKELDGKNLTVTWCG